MIEEILVERGTTHGHFPLNASVSQELKAICHHHGKRLTPSQREALDNVCQKMARILTGNANHVDSWLDISGYTTLIVKELTHGTD